MKHLVVGLSSTLTAEQADRLKTMVERHVGLPVVVIGGCSALVVIDTADVVEADLDATRRDAVCGICGLRFSPEEWDERHDAVDGGDIHAECCLRSGPCSNATGATSWRHEP